jgi:hypothetical protein
MCWNEHHQTLFLSKNFLFVYIQHEISADLHLNVSLKTNKQTSSDWLTVPCGSVEITSNLQLYAARLNMSRTCKLTVLNSIVTCSLLYIHQNIHLFVIIFLTVPIRASHGSTNTSARCDWLQIELNNWGLNGCAPGSDTAAIQTPVSPPQPCNCSN